MLALESASDSQQHAIQIPFGFSQSNPTLHYTPTSGWNSFTPNACWTHCRSQSSRLRPRTHQPRWAPAHCVEISWPLALPRRCPTYPRLSPQLVLKRRQLPQPHHFPRGVEWETTCCWAANVEVTSVADCTRTILPSSISLKQAHTADSYHLFCLLLRFHCREGRWKGFIMQPQSDPLLHSVQATIGHVRAVQVDPKPLLGWGPPCNTRTTGWAVEEHPQPCTILKASLRSCGGQGPPWPKDEAAWPSGWQLCLQQRSWSWMAFQVSSNTSHSVILRFWRSKNLSSFPHLPMKKTATADRRGGKDRRSRSTKKPEFPTKTAQRCMWQGLSEAKYQCHRSGRKGDARKRCGVEAGGIQRNAGGDAENGTRKTERPGQK